MNELIIKECPDAALILFALDDESSLDEAETILKILQKTEFLFTQVIYLQSVSFLYMFHHVYSHNYVKNAYKTDFFSPMIIKQLIYKLK